MASKKVVKKAATKMYRQGDILLVPAKALPERPKELEIRVVAEGEATGHHHQITGAATLFRPEYWSRNELYVQVAGPAQLVHEEHGAIDLEPGVYRAIRQREYDPVRERRWVRD